MTDKELIELLQKKPPFGGSKDSYYYELLEKIGGLKANYTKYMTTAPICCDEELKRLPTADFGLCCALLTMLLREDYFMQYGQFDKRYEKGDVGRIIDRMIAVLEEKTPDGANEEIKPGRYRHFKGKEYEVLFTAQHSETEEQMVVYRALYGERKIWVRPVSMWNETVEVNGERRKRFEYLPPKHYLFALQDYFEENGLAETSPIDTEVAARKAGKQYSLSDHIRGLVYSMLTSQTVWASVAPKLPEIDRVFHDYDPEWLKSASADDLIKAVFDLKCGNRSTAAQIKALPKNIAVFERIEKRYGSMDAFVTSQPPASIVEMLSESSSPYKLAQVGKALAWEYIRNVGVDGAKPDTHLRRFLSSRRMGTGRNADCTIDEVLTQVNALSAETGLSQATIDYLIWTFCASKHFDICSSTPHCERCPLSGYCNYPQHSTGTERQA